MHYYDLFHWILIKKAYQCFLEGNLLWLRYLKEKRKHCAEFILQTDFTLKSSTRYCLVIFLGKLTSWGCIKRYFPVKCPFSFFWKFLFKGTDMQIEKVLINDPLHVSKASRKFSILIIYNFEGIHLWSLLFS